MLFDEHSSTLVLPQTNTSFEVYLLGTVDFDAALILQRRLVYEISGNRNRAALILCQHPSMITVGRQGSYAHILCDHEEMQTRQWSVRWVNRGGGCWLHGPGQLAIYPILPLDSLYLTLQEYISGLQSVIISLMRDFSVKGQTRVNQTGVWVANRQVASIGIAVRDWVTYYGMILNVNPALEGYQLVRSNGDDDQPMTSLARERYGPISPSLVRQQLIEHFTQRFSFSEMSLFTDHALLKQFRES